ncbi:hypothetical protein L0337_24315 [candidate division KSB1 bacterium]|nr:hypothetical protein [candidate division KSB1 bacterium]
MKPKLQAAWSLAFALVCSAQLWAGDAAVLKPASPQAQDEVTLTYDPAVSPSGLKEAKAVTAQIFLCGSELDKFQREELALTRQQNLWQGKFKITLENAAFGIFYFESSDGKKDDNSQQYWDFSVVGANGLPVKNAYLWRGLNWVFPLISDMRRTQDKERAKAELQKELELYPNNWTVYLALKQADKDYVLPVDLQTRVDRDFEANKNDFKKLASFYHVYMRALNDSSRAAEIADMIIAQEPKGRFALQNRVEALFKERDLDKRAAMAEQILADFPVLPKGLESIKELLLNTKLNQLVRNKDVAGLDKFLASNKIESGVALNNVAWGLIKQDINVERGAELARQGIELLKQNAAKEEKPPQFSAKAWQKQQHNQLGVVQDTYALGLYKLGRIDEAERSYAEAVANMDYSDVGVNERYVKLLVERNKLDLAIAAAEKAAAKERITTGLIEAYKQAYEKKHGTGSFAAIETKLPKPRKEHPEHPGGEHPSEHPSEHPTAQAKEVTKESLAEAITSYINKDAELKGGYFCTYDPEAKAVLVLTLDKVHQDKLAKVSEGVYFACCDFKATNGKMYDLDFFMKATDSGLQVSEVTIHKESGKPRYGWVEKDGVWSKQPRQ